MSASSTSGAKARCISKYELSMLHFKTIPQTSPVSKSTVISKKPGPLKTTIKIIKKNQALPQAADPSSFGAKGAQMPSPTGRGPEYPLVFHNVLHSTIAGSTSRYTILIPFSSDQQDYLSRTFIHFSRPSSKWSSISPFFLLH